MSEVTLEQVPQAVRDLFNKGFSALERGNLEYAIELLMTCVERSPGFLQARKYLRAAQIKRLKGKPITPASVQLSTIAGLPQYLGLMAKLKGRKADQALVAAEKLMGRDPLNPNFAKLFAEAAVLAGLPEAAIQTLEIVFERFPKDGDLCERLGRLHRNMKHTSEAKNYFERLCDLRPNDPDAIKAVKDAVAMDTMTQDGWVSAAKEGQGGFRQMIKDRDEAVRLEKRSKAVKTDEDADVLIEDFQRKIEAEPENMNYYRALAKLYAGKEVWEDAISTLETALAKNPGDPEVERNVSEYKVRLFDRRIAEAADSGDEATRERLTMEKAQFVFDDVQDRIARYPNDLGLRFQWGELLFQNDYLNEAIEQFQLSQRSPAHRTRSLYYLAMSFKQKGQYDMAMSQLETAASEMAGMDKNKKDVVYELGTIAEMMGNTEAAVGYFKQIYQADIGYRDVAAKIERAYRK